MEISFLKIILSGALNLGINTVKKWSINGFGGVSLFLCKIPCVAEYMYFY